MEPGVTRGSPSGKEMLLKTSFSQIVEIGSKFNRDTIVVSALSPSSRFMFSKVIDSVGVVKVRSNKMRPGVLLQPLPEHVHILLGQVPLLQAQAHSP